MLARKIAYHGPGLSGMSGIATRGIGVRATIEALAGSLEPRAPG